MLIFCIQSDIQGNYKLIMSFGLGVHIFYGQGAVDPSRHDLKRHF